MESEIPADRRVASRHLTANLVIHNDPGDPTPGRTRGLGVTLDVNEFGLRVQATEALPLGETFRFSVALANEVVTAVGKVVHVERALNGTFEVGVEFLEISARDIERVQRFVRERGTDPLTPPPA